MVLPAKLEVCGGFPSTRAATEAILGGFHRQRPATLVGFLRSLVVFPGSPFEELRS
ncbi:MAG: hypothetical protein ABSE49_18565 [Polyangiaceae bacterium]